MRKLIKSFLLLSIYKFVVTLGAIFGRSSSQTISNDANTQDANFGNDYVVWYGDQRGGNDDEDSVFYDVVYDDALCSAGELTTFSYSKYIFLGPILSSTAAVDKENCAKSCYDNAGCKSANFYKTTSQPQGGQCELMSMSYYDRPSWLTPLEDGVYMEDVRCNGVSNTDLAAADQKSSDWKFISTKDNYYDVRDSWKHPNY